MDEDSFHRTISNYKLEIDMEILRFFSEKEQVKTSMKKEYDLLLRFLLEGGKRLRPIIILETYKGLGGTKDILRQSLSVEFFHNFTLIEDDVMDEDESRRNKPTIHKVFKDNFLRNHSEIRYKGSLFDRQSSKFAVSNSMILANILYAFGERCILRSSFKKDIVNDCLKLYNDAMIRVNEGQFYDLSFEKKKTVSEEEYLRMVEGKSAFLIKTCVNIGCVLGGANKPQLEALSRFANDITIAFQVHDDLMDISKSANKGHELGSDIRQGKKTVVIIKALERANSDDKRKILKVLGLSDASKKEVLEVVKVMHKTGAVKYCHDFCKQKVNNGKEWLKKVGLKSENEEFLSAIADYFISRKI